MTFKALLAPVAFAALLTTSGVALADPTAYTTQASFLAAISAAGVDSFDDLDYTTTLATPLSRTAGAYSYTASADPQGLFYPTSADGIDVWLSPYNNTDTVTFSNFSADVRGVGGFFFGTNSSGVLTAVSSLTITATDADGSTTEFLLDPSTTSFLGFVSTSALTSLTVTSGQELTYATINDLTLGAAVAAVPEPETYALMLAGLGLVGWMARRHKA
ncbi:MAG: PEP-CTERM sorting domain-containing protein [Burkholderiales bacterium]